MTIIFIVDIVHLQHPSEFMRSPSTTEARLDDMSTYGDGPITHDSGQGVIIAVMPTETFTPILISVSQTSSLHINDSPAISSQWHSREVTTERRLIWPLFLPLPIGRRRLAASQMESNPSALSNGLRRLKRTTAFHLAAERGRRAQAG